MLDFKVRTTYGKTWAKLQPGDFLDDKFLNKIGDILVESIVYEAGKDFAKQGNAPTRPGEPEGLPRSVRFFDSFYHKISTGPSGVKRVEIWSSWPWIEQLTEGRNAYPMDWLTRQAGVSRVPMKGPGGTVLIKTTPASKEKAWIHPGFKKHNFIRRGYDRARRQMQKDLENQVIKVLKETKPA